MRNYNFYKQNNQEPYDVTETEITNITPKERILLGCIQCKETYTNAYKCNCVDCVFYQAKKKWMKRPHTCSEWFFNNKTLPKWLNK